MLWDDFKLYVWHRRREIDRRLEEEGDPELEADARRRVAEARRPPTRRELRAIPWSGDGPDPLETLYDAPAAGEEA